MEIGLPDFERIFLGDADLTFLVEIAFRTAIMFAWTLVLIRMMGRRSVGQLSLIEFMLVIALGSAVGDPMFYPDVPLLHGMAVVFVVVVVDRMLGFSMSRSDRVETFVEGNPLRVITEGRVDFDSLEASGLAREELFERLRIEGVGQLGQVRVAYFESNGYLSTFRYVGAEERPGLRIEPPESIEQLHTFEEDASAPVAGAYACARCGQLRALGAGEPFPECECGEVRWTTAIRSSDSDIIHRLGRWPESGP